MNTLKSRLSGATRENNHGQRKDGMAKDASLQHEGKLD
jgi:hypothetical protein